jgi:hypothetical protein
MSRFRVAPASFGSAIVAFLMALGVLHAQEFRATLTGRVLDPTGAAVPNATVQARNVATGETSSATTAGDGTYTIPFLRPGNYTLTVTASGFKTFVRENIVLQVGQVAGIDVKLEVGEVAESITVEARAAILETQTASRAAVIDTRQVADLPLNTRNPFMLGAMMPGVVFRGAAIWQRPFDNGAIAEWSVNGGRQMNNEFLLDGAPNNGQAGGNNIAYVPIVDAVQEFSIQQNSYDAQYGKTGGGIFNVVLKSGTQDFHVTAWEFLRRKWLDANTFQNNALGRNPDGTKKAERPAHRLDQYGFQVDGPLVLPPLFKRDGRIRGFFLGSWEGYYEEWPQFLRNSRPTEEMRRGDFSKLTTAGGQPIIIYDPQTTQFDAQGNPIRTPFPGNVIPPTRFNPIALNVTKYMPLPNATTPGVRYATQNHLMPQYAATDDFYNLILKFDFNIGDRHRAFFRHASNDRTEDRCINGICSGPGMDGQQPFQRINDAYVLDWVGTLSPTLVANLRGSYNRFIERGYGRGNEGFDLTTLGLPKSVVDQLPTPRYFGRWEFSGVYSVLGRYRGENITNNYALMGNVTKIWGPHTVKMGIDVRRIHYILRSTGNILYFNATAAPTQRLWNQGEDTAGDPYASFLLGLVSGSAFYPVYPFNRQWYVAPYIQDDWKVTRRLTLNLGLRWDYNGPPDEKWNRLNRGFNTTVTSPLVQQLPPEAFSQYPELRNLKGGLEFAGVGGNPRIAANRDWNNIQPRIGVAYQLMDRVVMRGGYGLYYMNPNNDYLKYVGFSISTPVVNSLDDGRTYIPQVLSNPFPAGINVPPGSRLGYLTFVGQDTAWFDPTFRTPYVHQFSFGFQFQVTRVSTLEVSYVGSRTVGANDQRDFNVPVLNFRKQCNLLEGGSPAFCNASVPNPFRGVAAFAGTAFYSAPTVSRYQMNRPFPQFSGNMTQQGLNTSKIWYNSLQVQFQQRVSRGLNLIANYTLSKMVERWGYNDPVAGVPQQGLYFNDRPHWVKITPIYDLPFGRGRRWGANTTGLVSKLISGWQINFFLQAGSGEPADMPGNAVPLKPLKNLKPKWNQHQVRGWSPCVLRLYDDGRLVPQPYSLAAGCGNDFANYDWLRLPSYAPRMTPFRSGQIRMNPLFNVDAALIKDTNFTERLRFQFAIEAFNATNTFYFGRERFNTNPDDPNFGTVFPSQAWIGNGYPRQVQLRFKLFW